MFASDRVEFFEFELVSLGPRVLFGDVEIAGIGAANQLNQDGVGLGHRQALEFKGAADRTIAIHRYLSRRARLAASLA
jgi:hypothetical protein